MNKKKSTLPKRAIYKDTRSLKNYFDYIYSDQCDSISPEEETRRFKRKNKEDFEIIIRTNLRFVVRVAENFQGCGVPVDDLINAGNLGLIVAYHKFNVDLGYKFISLAQWYIRLEIYNLLGKLSLPVRMSNGTFNLYSKVRKILNKSDEYISDIDMAKKVKRNILITRAVYNLVAQKQQRGHSITGLNHPVAILHVDRINTEDREKADKNMYDNRVQSDIEKALSILSNNQRYVITHYYGLFGHKAQILEDIGRNIGVSRERVRQIKNLALSRLRKSEHGKLLRDYL